MASQKRNMLITLPVELVVKICELLADALPMDLPSFAMSCRHILRLARPTLSRNITIFIRGPALLAANIAYIEERLEKTDCLQHVRSLNLIGLRHFTVGSKHREVKPEKLGVRLDHGYGNSVGQSISGCYDKCIADCFPEYVEQTASKHWSSLVEFIPKLTGLRDVAFPCSTKMPACLLDTIDGMQCRLHLGHFRLRSLHQPKLYEIDRKLLNSRSLYSISVWYAIHHTGNTYLPRDYDPSWMQELLSPEEAERRTSRQLNPDTTLLQPDFNKEALMLMLGGQAPNLRDLSISFGECRGQLDGGISPAAYTRPQCQVLDISQWQGAKIPCTVDSIYLGGMPEYFVGQTADRCSPGVLFWTSQFDFTKLRKLESRMYLHLPSLRQLVHTANFVSLRELAFDVGTCESFYRGPRVSLEDSPEYKSLFEHFLSNLPPLESLQLRGIVDGSMFEAIMSRHGRTLKTFYFLPCQYHESFACEVDQVRQLYRCCPLLQSLTIPILRHQGNASERAIYEALGMLRLRHLSLQLNVHPAGRLNDQSNDLIPSIRDLVINACVDEQLIRAIFLAIRSGSPMGMNTLSSLELKPACNNQFTDKVSSGDVYMLGREWLVRPSNELGRETMPTIIDVAEGPLYDEEHAGNISALREVWPGRKSGEAWGRHVYSHPLSMSALRDEYDPDELRRWEKMSVAEEPQSVQEWTDDDHQEE